MQHGFSIQVLERKEYTMRTRLWLFSSVQPGCGLAELAAGGAGHASNNTLTPKATVLAIGVRVLTLIHEWQLQERPKCLLPAIIKSIQAIT
jgi:hypothetical protein